MLTQLSHLWYWRRKKFPEQGFLARCVSMSEENCIYHYTRVYINISSHCTFKNVKKENKNRQGFKTCAKIEISLNVSSSSSSLCYLENRNEHRASLKKKHSYSHLHPYPPPWGLTKWVIDMMFFGPCTMLSDRLR